MPDLSISPDQGELRTLTQLVLDICEVCLLLVYLLHIIQERSRRRYYRTFPHSLPIHSHLMSFGACSFYFRPILLPLTTAKAQYGQRKVLSGRRDKDR